MQAASVRRSIARGPAVKVHGTTSLSTSRGRNDIRLVPEIPATKNPAAAADLYPYFDFCISVCRLTPALQRTVRRPHTANSTPRCQRCLRIVAPHGLQLRGIHEATIEHADYTISSRGMRFGVSDHDNGSARSSSSVSISITASPLAVSRLPVGSSARIT